MALGSRRSRWAAFAVVVVAAVFSSSCNSNESAGPGRSPSSTESTRATPPTFDRSGGRTFESPFRTDRWAGGRAPTDTVLFDGGDALTSFTFSGERRELWRHEAVEVTDLAAGPGGTPIAMAVALRAEDDDDPSSALFLLAEDGTIQRLDVLTDFAGVVTPVFARAPARESGPVELYWVRHGSGFGHHGRPVTQVVRWDGKDVREVAVPLRGSEGIVALHAYPGAARIAAVVTRRVAEPAVYSVLLNIDADGAVNGADETTWSTMVTRADTDTALGVAWLSPSDYAIPITATANHPGTVVVRRFRVRCEYRGSAVLYRGTEIDTGETNAFWRVLPAEREGLLVVTVSAALELDESLGNGGSGESGAVWHRLELGTGSVAPTTIPFATGGWTVVQPDVGSEVPVEPDCDQLAYDVPL